MTASLDLLLDQFERGIIDRRQLLTGLALATGGALVGKIGTADAQSGATVMPVRSINHFHIHVSDFQKSADFYSAVFGAKIRDKSKILWTMTFPNATAKAGSWISLQKAEPGKAGVYDHVGLGVDIPNLKSTEELSAELNKRFPSSNAKPTGPSDEQGSNNGARSIYFTDPDGLKLQVNAPNDDGWLPKSLK